MLGDWALCPPLTEMRLFLFGLLNATLAADLDSVNLLIMFGYEVLVVCGLLSRPFVGICPVSTFLSLLGTREYLTIFPES